nr:hypothetical protein HK105_005961 [Polyrhizophydium stewartii]
MARLNKPGVLNGASLPAAARAIYGQWSIAADKLGPLDRLFESTEVGRTPLGLTSPLLLFYALVEAGPRSMHLLATARMNRLTLTEPLPHLVESLCNQYKLLGSLIPTMTDGQLVTNFCAAIRSVDWSGTDALRAALKKPCPFHPNETPHQTVEGGKLLCRNRPIDKKFESVYQQVSDMANAGSISYNTIARLLREKNLLDPRCAPTPRPQTRGN